MRSVTDISVPQNEFICSFPVSEVKTDYILLYSFFWVIPWCLNFVCQHFGTLCLFHLHRRCKQEEPAYTAYEDGTERVI